MRKNKKGFTLIELLAVIVILAIIALIATPIVLNLIKRARLGAAQDSAYGLRKAAQLYYATELISDPNFSSIEFTCSNDGCVYEYTVGEETKTKKLEIDGTKPSNGTVTIESNGTITYSNIKFNNNAYSCHVPESGTIKCVEGEMPHTYANGEVVYYNPVTGSKCTDYTEANSLNETKTGCLKWYAFNDGVGSDKVKLLLDHNTTAKVQYNSDNTNTEMKEIKPEINKLTSENKWKDTPRLITADEIAQITGNTSFSATSPESASWFYLDSNNQTQTANASNKSKYAWLFDYTNGCTGYGCNVADSSTNAYWTSSKTSGSSTRMWIVFLKGSLGSNNASDANGVRPVIETLKSNL